MFLFRDWIGDATVMRDDRDYRRLPVSKGKSDLIFQRLRSRGRPLNQNQVRARFGNHVYVIDIAVKL